MVLSRWHYVLTGSPDTPFEGGQYHGILKFPGNFPFSPPAIRMTTPSGRFKPGERICLTISDFHPEQWNPAWTVGSILTGLLSFMVSDEHTTGSVRSSDTDKRKFAKASKEWNYKKNPEFVKQFPDLVKEYTDEKVVVKTDNVVTNLEKVVEKTKRKEPEEDLDEIEIQAVQKNSKKRITDSKPIANNTEVIVLD